MVRVYVIYIHLHIVRNNAIVSHRLCVAQKKKNSHFKTKKNRGIKNNDDIKPETLSLRAHT